MAKNLRIEELVPEPGNTVLVTLQGKLILVASELSGGMLKTIRLRLAYAEEDKKTSYEISVVEEGSPVPDTAPAHSYVYNSRLYLVYTKLKVVKDDTK
jgi:hypothetical protein